MLGATLRPTSNTRSSKSDDCPPVGQKHRIRAKLVKQANAISGTGLMLGSDDMEFYLKKGMMASCVFIGNQG